MLKKQICFLGFVMVITCVPLLDLFPYPKMDDVQFYDAEIQIPDLEEEVNPEVIDLV